MENPSMFESLFAEYRTELFRFVLGILRDASLANDAVQSTFVRGLQSPPVGDRTSLKGWIFKVAFHEALQCKRSQAIEKRAFEKLKGTIAEAEKYGPVDWLVRQESIAKVKLGLQQLSPDQREVVRLRMYENKTFAEIAEQLSLPLGTVLTRMRLATEKLRKLLSEGGVS